MDQFKTCVCGVYMKWIKTFEFGQRKQPIEPNQIKFQTTEQDRVAGMMVYRRLFSRFLNAIGGLFCQTTTVI